MIHIYFAAAESGEQVAEGLPLGLSPQAFIVQLITFILIFFLLKRFAFEPIVKMLDRRHQVIEAGVKHGAEMEKERANLLKETDKIIRESRHDADAIINDAQKEGREIVREAEKSAHKKTEIMLADAEARLDEESEQARRKLEKEIAGLVSEATEAVVEEKVDAKKDADLIDRAIKKGSK
ncbi:MAG: F0F1 ATP synthase subunit B [bacterium]|nr:F0F1 ATP synthase subunit B [bacterium]